MQQWKQYEASKDFLVTVSACHLNGSFCILNGNNIDKAVQLKATRRSLRSTLAGTRLRIWYFGHLMFSPPPHISYHRLRHLKQKLCSQGSCLGSVNKSEHTEQETSPQRLWNSVVGSMVASGTKAKWPSMHISSFSETKQTSNQSRIAVLRTPVAPVLVWVRSSECGVWKIRSVKTINQKMRVKRL